MTDTSQQPPAQKRKAGRPKIDREYLVGLTTSLPLSIAQRLDAFVAARETTKISVVSNALTYYMDTIEAQEAQEGGAE